MTPFQVTQKLGEGGCGSVFKVEDIEEKNQQYALKVEFNSAQAGNVLKMEVQILSLMINKKHVAKCFASGKKERYSYMVMTLLGESLDSLVRKHGPFLNVSSQIRIGISVLFGIKQIHDGLEAG
uniref:Protein kinase domain-containing protein n=1 Tax=Caenorhabditis tropicalis TaxID=1561998 RepID=A0A1I7TL00_9PELO